MLTDGHRRCRWREVAMKAKEKETEREREGERDRYIKRERDR